MNTFQSYRNCSFKFETNLSKKKKKCDHFIDTETYYVVAKFNSIQTYLDYIFRLGKKHFHIQNRVSYVSVSLIRFVNISHLEQKNHI